MNREKSDSVASELKEQGFTVISAPCDVTNEEDYRNSLDRVIEEVIYPLVPQRRLLSVTEIANYAVFLASEKAKGVTGQAVVLDGGYTVQ